MSVNMPVSSDCAIDAHNESVTNEQQINKQKIKVQVQYNWTMITLLLQI